MRRSEEYLSLNVFSEGLLARALGRACSRNPYPSNSDEASLWERGWRSIDDSYGNIPQVCDLPPSLPPMLKAALDADERGHSVGQIAMAARFKLLRFVEAAVPLGLIAVLLALAVFRT
jgi:hypothetical protein